MIVSFTFFFYQSRNVYGQEETADTLAVDFQEQTTDTFTIDFQEQMADTIVADTTVAAVIQSDSMSLADTIPPLTFTPDPAKAIWYALVCPGLGQIYNRSYWKVPILYGGIATLSYLIIWNGRMYNDYRNAYHDIMDNDPQTNSFEAIFYNMQGVDMNWKQSTLDRKQNFYRRNRDLSIFGMVALYAISVIDSFVDAQLYNFSVSEDLTLRVEPVINDFFHANDAFNPRTLGFRCLVKF